MTKDEIVAKTNEVFAEAFEVEAAQLQPDKHIFTDLGLDSLGVMELVADIEDRFSVTIPNDVLSDIATVDDVAKALVKLAPHPGLFDGARCRFLGPDRWEVTDRGATWPGDCDDPAQLLGVADRCVYRAKEAGREVSYDGIRLTP